MFVADMTTNTASRIGNNQPSTKAFLYHSGTYLNTLFPAAFSLNISQWHYCYYTEYAKPGSMLSMTVAVWSLDVATDTYIINPSSVKLITIQAISTLASIHCNQELLTDHVSVMKGATVGVIIPSKDAIPVVGFDSSETGNYLMKTNSVTNGNIATSELSNGMHLSLHLYSSSSKY